MAHPSWHYRKEYPAYLDCPNPFKDSKEKSADSFMKSEQRVCVNSKTGASWSDYEKISEETEEAEKILEENAQKGEMERIKENVKTHFSIHQLMENVLTP